ncbi:MAG TPA: lipase secretion chaperone [Dyella sp.]|nr:lipase secretion chaperone [Dyella sp.]
MQRPAWAACAVAAASLAWMAWMLHAPVQARPQVESAAPGTIAAPAGGHAGGETLPPAPRAASGDPERVLREGSLRGTAVDGGVTLGFAGRVQPDLALRRLFDYYLSLLGETDLPGVRQLLREELQRRPLDAGQQAEVMTLFDRYVDYQRARAALAGTAGSDLAARLAQDRTLRQRMLGPALARAFYPTADADDARLLRQLAHADAPDPAVQDEHALATVAATIQAQTEQLAASPLGPAQRHAERAAAWGEAAADRLDALDRQRARWQQRLDAFAAAASAVERDPSLDDAQRRAAMDRLLDRQFEGTERLQARTMWQAGLLPGTR